MINLRKSSFWIPLIGMVIVGIVAVTLGIVLMTAGNPSSVELGEQRDREQHDAKISVAVVHPMKGPLERVSTQPAIIQAFESARLFAKVSGYLKKQTVDIGSRVKKGDVLAVVDVPELESQLKRDKAGIKHAHSRVAQMKARVGCAKADLDAAKAAVTEAEAVYQSALAWVRYRNLQHQRMKDLFASGAIDDRLMEESKEQLEASKKAESSAKEAITTNMAKVVASQAKIDDAQAGVDEAESAILVAEAEREKHQAQIGFATIVAPFDGVVTERRFFPGDYIRSAKENCTESLLTVERTDLFRVVIQIPDRDVPFIGPGGPAIVELDALPGKDFPAKVSRIAKYQDPQTHLMRAEIDLPNPMGKLCRGMHGQAKIILTQERDLLSIPSECVVGNVKHSKGTVFVVRDGHAHQVSVHLGTNNGLRVAVPDGLTRGDEVILHPSSTLSEGVEVIPKVAD